MKPILLYLLQVIVCSGLLYGYYHLLLRNKRFHQYNRYYLLAAAVISMLVPFLNIPVYFSSEDSKAVWLDTLNDISATGYYILTGSGHNTPDLFTWNNLLLALYIIASMFVSYRFVKSVLAIRRIINKYKTEKLEGVHFVNTEEPGTPFSFFSWMFWNKKIQLDSADGQQIFRHELFHIKQKHTIDILFIEILTVVFWINPFFHLIKKELTTIHEFLADQFAVKENEKWNYAELLLMHLLGAPNLRFTHPFFHNQIKRRIAMITSSQKPSYQYFRKVLVLPLLVLIAGLFAFTYKQKQEAKVKPENTVVSVKEMPQSPVVEMVLTDTPPRNRLKGVKIKSDDAVVEKIVIGNQLLKKDGNPLYVVDDVVIQKDKGALALQAIVPDNIESITVLKDKSAIDKYGVQATDGVIEIRTKQLKEVQLKKVQGFEIKEDHPELKEIVIEGRPIEPVKTQSVKLSEVVVEGKKLQVKEVPTVAGYALKEDRPDLAEVVVEGKRSGISPSFPGGQSEWIKYLQKQLNANVPVDNGAPAGNYTVYVQFVVDADGLISDLKAVTNHGFGMEEEVLRVIKLGPKWVPATQNGKAVKAFKKQPVTFAVAEEEPADVTLSELVVHAVTKPKALNEAEVAKLNPLYPNPTTNNFTIQYNTDTPGAGEIMVQDITGKVYKVERTTFIKGLNTLNVNVSTLPAGTYIVGVKDASKKLARVYKMMKEK